jgi:hypothetical protein
MWGVVGLTASATMTAEDALRVLIVEDHAILTHSLCLALRVDGLGPHVASALDDDAVLAEAVTTQPDVVLLDLNLVDGHTSIGVIGPLVGAGHRGHLPVQVTVDDATPLGPFRAGTTARPRPAEIGTTGRVIRFDIARSTGGNVGAVEIRVDAAN